MIENASKAYKLFSVQALALIATLSGLASQWDALPQAAKDAVPKEWVPYITGVVAILGIVGRLVSEPTEQADNK